MSDKHLEHGQCGGGTRGGGEGPCGATGEEMPLRQRPTHLDGTGGRT